MPLAVSESSASSGRSPSRTTSGSNTLTDGSRLLWLTFRLFWSSGCYRRPGRRSVRGVDSELTVHQVVVGRRPGRAAAGPEPVEPLDGHAEYSTGHRDIDMGIGVVSHFTDQSKS